MKTSRFRLAAGACALLADTSPAGDKPNEKRELLSEHETVAKLTGVAYQQCRGLTAQCPDNCGQSGDYATFAVVAYLSYKKPGQYGDPKGTSFTFQVEDNHKNLKVPKELADKVRALRAGDVVLLAWRHDYVTRTENGGSSSFPERPVTKLETITQDQADKLIKQAADGPVSQPATASAPAPSTPSAGSGQARPTAR